MSSTFGGIRHSPSTFTSSPASTTLFRRLIWEGTVPLEIRVDSKELPANSNRGLECYFIQAPRVSYLPLLIPEIKRFLQDVVFDDEAARLMKEEDWWFESEEGHLLKWCVSARDGCPRLSPFGTGNLQALASWSYV
jgi:autophagy-related protein 5